MLERITDAIGLTNRIRCQLNITFSFDTGIEQGQVFTMPSGDRLKVASGGIIEATIFGFFRSNSVPPVGTTIVVRTDHGRLWWDECLPETEEIVVSKIELRDSTYLLHVDTKSYDISSDPITSWEHLSDLETWLSSIQHDLYDNQDGMHSEMHKSWSGFVEVWPFKQAQPMSVYTIGSKAVTE